jgi:hypothetical protein
VQALQLCSGLCVSDGDALAISAAVVIRVI